MGLTGGMRATIATGTAAMLGGVTVTLHGVVRSDPSQALGGVSLTMIALTLIALYFIHRWFTNTSEERRILSERTRAADDERNRYVSLKAALENERGRLTRDMAAERAGLAARLAAERAALSVDFEERRAALMAEAMETTVRMFYKGKFAPKAKKIGNLIPFPEQQHEPSAARERSHEQGSLRP